MIYLIKLGGAMRYITIGKRSKIMTIANWLTEH